MGFFDGGGVGVGGDGEDLVVAAWWLVRHCDGWEGRLEGVAKRMWCGMECRSLVSVESVVNCCAPGLRTDGPLMDRDGDIQSPLNI